MAESALWELSNEESFSTGHRRGLGRRFCLCDDRASARKLRAGTGRSSIASLRGRRIWWAHLPLSRNLNPFPGHAENQPITGMDGPEPRGLRPRSQNRDVWVPETRRIRDVPFEEHYSERGSASRIAIRFRGRGGWAMPAHEATASLGDRPFDQGHERPQDRPSSALELTDARIAQAHHGEDSQQGPPHDQFPRRWPQVVR